MRTLPKSESLSCLSSHHARSRRHQVERVSDADLHRRIALRRGEALDTLLREWCEREPSTRYRDLAMLQLYTLGGWTMPTLTKTFDLAKGHLARRLHLTAESIRSEFDLDLGSFETTGDADDDH